jgi:transcriptional regulator with XRE-family HTH domain
MANALSVRQRLIGSSLRRYRESLGYDLGVAAQILECDPSKISRIETGQRGIRPKELRELLTEYGVDAATQDTLAAIARPGEDARWWREYTPVLSAGQLDYLAAESAASTIMTYAPVQIPELLHTPDYARAVASADVAVPEGAEDATVAAVLARQGATLQRRHTGLTVVVGETALRQNIGGAEVLRAQLRHLSDLTADSPQVTIYILPFSAGGHAAGGSGAFSVLQFSRAPALGLVHVAGPSGGICLDTPSVVDTYVRTFTHLRLFALTPQDSARKLRQMSRG